MGSMLQPRTPLQLWLWARRQHYAMGAMPPQRPNTKVEFRLAKANLIARLLVSLHDQPAHDVSPMLAVEISETHLWTSI
jgi:hypothetical protein